jgi:hypothetical protein
VTIGAGKYDREASFLLEITEAELVVVIVGAGNRGHGFSLQLVHQGDVVAKLRASVATLREAADNIERDIASGEITGQRPD